MSRCVIVTFSFLLAFICLPLSDIGSLIEKPKAVIEMIWRPGIGGHQCGDNTKSWRGKLDDPLESVNLTESNEIP